MAACSEQDLDGTLSVDNHATFPVSSATVQSNEHCIKNSRSTDRFLPKKSGSNEAVNQTEHVDLSKLHDDDFKELLDELVDFDQPTNKASLLVQKLRQEVVDNDDYDQSTPLLNPGSNAVNSYGSASGRYRRTRAKGVASSNIEFLFADVPGSTNGPKRNRPVLNSFTAKPKEDAVVKGSKKAHQFQSLQDLSDTVCTAGLGRGSCKLQKTGRANSFTLSNEDSMEWTSLQSRYSSSPDAFRNSTKNNKLKGGKSKLPNASPAGDSQALSESSGDAMAEGQQSSENMNHCDSSSPPEATSLVCEKSDVLNNREGTELMNGPKVKSVSESGESVEMKTYNRKNKESDRDSMPWRRITYPGLEDGSPIPLTVLSGPPINYEEGYKLRIGGGSSLMTKFIGQQDFASVSHGLDAQMTRKSKRNRTHPDDSVVLAENIKGHRGRDSIETLLEYIQSSDDKGKPKGTNGNNNNIGKVGNTTNNDINKKKVNNKDTKTIKKSPNGNIPKKKISSSTEDEDQLLEQHSQDVVNNNIPVSQDSMPPQERQSSFEDKSDHLENTSSLDDDSVYDNFNKGILPSNSDIGDRSGSPSFYSDIGIYTDSGNYKVDLSSFSDVDHVSESEFRVVTKKKPRRRSQLKKSEGFHRQTPNNPLIGGAAERDYYMKKNKSSEPDSLGILRGLPLSNRNQRGKSTSSVPHSEQSSPENSDVDSVHSLPVRGTAQLALQSHPHTTPSSSSSTPQTSYADITRMSVSFNRNKLPLSQGQDNYLSLRTQKSLEHEESTKCFESSNPVFSSKNTPPELFSNSTDTRVPLDVDYEQMIEDSIYVVEQSCINSQFTSRAQSSELESVQCAKDTKESNTQTDGILPVNSPNTSGNISASESVPSGVSCASVSVNSSHLSRTQSNPGNNPHDSSDNSSSATPVLSSAPEQALLESKNPSEKEERPAVIIMGNCLPQDDISDITFGFDINEQLMQMTFDGNLFMPSATFLTPVAANENISGLSCSINPGIAGPELPEDCIIVSGRNFQWSEPSVDIGKFNHQQVVDYLGCAWCRVQTDIEKENSQAGNMNKIIYYCDASGQNS